MQYVVYVIFSSCFWGIQEVWCWNNSRKTCKVCSFVVFIFASGLNKTTHELTENNATYSEEITFTRPTHTNVSQLTTRNFWKGIHASLCAPHGKTWLCSAFYLALLQLSALVFRDMRVCVCVRSGVFVHGSHLHCAAFASVPQNVSSSTNHLYIHPSFITHGSRTPSAQANFA